MPAAGRSPWSIVATPVSSVGVSSAALNGLARWCSQLDNVEKYSSAVRFNSSSEVCAMSAFTSTSGSSGARVRAAGRACSSGAWTNTSRGRKSLLMLERQMAGRDRRPEPRPERIVEQLEDIVEDRTNGSP